MWNRRSGPVPLALVPWSDRGLVATLNTDITEVRPVHPTAAPEDLLASFVPVVVRRPT